MGRRVRAGIQHKSHPMHVYCRLVDLARLIARIYENLIYKPFMKFTGGKNHEP